MYEVPENGTLDPGAMWFIYGGGAGSLQLDNKEHVFGICFIALLGLATLVNFLIIVFFVSKKKYKKSYHMAYLNLAVTDLLISVYGTGVRGPSIIWNLKNATVCNITTYVATFVTMINFASIVPITFDRVVAVMFPYRYKDPSHRRHLKCLFISIWGAPIIVLLTISTYAHAHDMRLTQYFAESGLCIFGDWGHILFIYFLATFYYVLPLLFNVVSYTAIIWKLSQRPSHPLSLMLSLRACLICLLFTVAWLPHFIFHMAHADKQTMWRAQAFMYVNAILDPLLYLFSVKAMQPCVEKVRHVSRRRTGTVVPPALHNFRVMNRDRSAGSPSRL